MESLSAERLRPAHGIPARITETTSRRGAVAIRRSALLFLAAISCANPVSPLVAAPLSADAFQALAETCAPGVAPDLLARLVAAESGFEPHAIGVNGTDRQSYAPHSAAEAAGLANDLIARGASVDMGLGQINSANLGWLGLTTETVFEPCANLAATEAVLRGGYERSRAAGASRTDALGQALSAYNTGSPTRGFANGYVARVLEREVRPIHKRAQPTRVRHSAHTSPDWEVFGGSGTPDAQIFQ